MHLNNAVTSIYKTFKMKLLFLLLFIVKMFHSEKILESPRVTDWGSWGTWEHCPVGTFATGIQLYNHPSQGYFSDDKGLTGLKLFCNSFGGSGERVSIKSSVDKEGAWGKKYFCSRAAMTGFQMRHEPYRTLFMDDAAASNIRIYCDDSDNSYIEGDGQGYGKWTEKRLCSSQEAICGIQTQIDKSGSWDSTGLNNVRMKCCDIPHPLQDCVPRTTWSLVEVCSLSLNESSKVCAYSRKTGISYSNGKTHPTTLIYEKAGYNPKTLTDQFSSKFLNIPAIKLNSSIVYQEESSDYYWKLAKQEVWEPEISTSTNLTATKGQRIYLYQIRGMCGLLQTWGTKFMQVEYTKLNNHEIKSTTYFDFSSDFIGDDADFYPNQLKTLNISLMS